MQLLRSFDSDATFTGGDFAALSQWIGKNSRPAILPFDQRTIQSIFGESKQAFIFINTGDEKSAELRETVVREAKSHEGGLIFTEITVDCL